MASIKDILNKYSSGIDLLDLELILSRVLGRPREFVLTHPEHKISKLKIENLKFKISRRRRGEPLAYILGEKEFYGLNFKVNKNVLIPRPETEQIVELVTQNLKRKNKNTLIVDIGTGSGNIIIAVVKQLRNCKSARLPASLNRGEPARQGIRNYKLYATDISNKALIVARKNARFHKVDKKIKFLRGNLLNPLIGNWKLLASSSTCRSGEIGNSRMIILANLPYLSPALYRQSQISVKMYEPKKALLASKSGLYYYEKLFKQIGMIRCKCYMLNVTCFMEISPEQKPALQKLIKKYFPEAKINPHTKDSHRNRFGVGVKFYKDLANKWRVCEIEINAIA